MTNPPRLLKFPWHIGHDYELFKVPFPWSLLTDTSRSWAHRQRPLPDHVRLVTSENAAEHDLMLLHVDQWILDEMEKRALFEYWRDRFPGKLVVICHGCNFVDGCASEAMRQFLGDLPVVMNSPTAEARWDLANSRFIRHGFTPEEWPATDYADPRVIVIQSHQAGRHARFRNHDEVGRIERAGIDLCWVGRDVTFGDFDAYRDFLSHGSIVLNPSHASPNPRSRAEAMLCGLAPVTTRSHGEEAWLENGVNGFASDDLDELIEVLRDLQKNPEKARSWGEAARTTARDRFHIDLFASAWEDVVQCVMTGQPIRKPADKP